MLKVQLCPVTQVQLMKPGIGDNGSCAVGGFPFMETWFIDSTRPRSKPSISALSARGAARPQRRG